MDRVLDIAAPDSALARFVLERGIAAIYLVAFVVAYRQLLRLLQGDAPTLRLLRHNPFPGRPPRYVRAVLYRYRFTTMRERRETGAWWSRERLEEFVSPVWLREDGPGPARRPSRPWRAERA